jgi:hypothetical protein
MLAHRRLFRIASGYKYGSSYGLTLFGYFEPDWLGQTQRYLANSEVDRHWSEPVEPVMETEVHPKIDFPYLLPLQRHTE